MILIFASGKEYLGDRNDNKMVSSNFQNEWINVDLQPQKKKIQSGQTANDSFDVSSVSNSSHHFTLGIQFYSRQDQEPLALYSTLKS